ncbi:uncharacterized protein LOC110990748 isoform X2 [Acanthaster planci]|uniref:Uncharacterized protein LOC110990748 isoform X2 n=1 Tax=Acanthaster planci TaxID=133434 RepID=A0A8B8A1I1_ACAPL|nr:uncharacterized protein LOC110990748 isoform X2 [Acanthaster planci]
MELLEDLAEGGSPIPDYSSIHGFLRKWGVEQLLGLFEEHKIDLEVLPLLDEQTVTELIPQIGVRMKFLNGWRREVVGDNLGLHEVLGYVCSFSANYPCRFCKASKEVIARQQVEDAHLLRSQENYEDDASKEDPSATGIKRVPVLNELIGYHVTENLAPDVMHDLLEGVFPLEIKLTVKSLISQGCFTLDELNNRINSFSYGFCDKKNKPSPISLSALSNPGGPSGQKASQMACLAMYLPLIIGDKVQENDDVWEVYLLLLDIYKIVMARSISRSATYFLKHLIHDHHELFRQVHQRNLTPKQHFMLHYPRAIRYLGPLVQYSSMRFEAKHRQFKKWANACNNFKNIAKTVATKHQQAQSTCGRFLPKEDLQSSVEIQYQIPVPVSSLDDDVSSSICASLHCSEDSLIAVASKAEVEGYQMKPNSMVVTNWTEEGPMFSQIQQIIVYREHLYLVLKPWKVTGFSRHYHAYTVQELSNNICVKRPTELLDYRPHHITQCHSKDDSSIYIAVRFNLV